MITDTSEGSLKAFLKTLPQVDEVGANARAAMLATRSIKTVSYTHLTLPTNREV